MRTVVCLYRSDQNKLTLPGRKKIAPQTPPAPNSPIAHEALRLMPLNKSTGLPSAFHLWLHHRIVLTYFVVKIIRTSKYEPAVTLPPHRHTHKSKKTTGAVSAHSQTVSNQPWVEHLFCRVAAIRRRFPHARPDKNRPPRRIRGRWHRSGNRRKKCHCPPDFTRRGHDHSIHRRRWLTDRISSVCVTL